MSFTWNAVVDGEDIAEIVLAGASVSYGRSTLFDQPAPPTATLQLVTKDYVPSLSDRWPEFSLGDHSQTSGYVDTYADTYAGPSSRITLAAPVHLEASTASGYVDTYEEYYTGSTLRRFTGQIVSIDYDPDIVTITAVTNTAEWSRIEVGGTDSTTPIPAETDVARITRLVNEAGLAITIDGAAGPTLNPIPIDTRPSPLMDQLRAIAVDAGGLLFSCRDGVMHYRTRNATAYPSVEIDPGITLVDPLRMSLDLSLVRNRITVEYGITDEVTNLRPEITVEDTVQITKFGIRDQRFTTNIQGLADATAHATWLLSVLDPAWSMPDATVALTLAGDNQIDALAGVEQGTPVTLPQLLPGSPQPDYAAAALGYTESISSSDWQITYHLAPTATFAT
jgi:hypothetical protein